MRRDACLGPSNRGIVVLGSGVCQAPSCERELRIVSRSQQGGVMAQGGGTDRGRMSGGAIVLLLAGGLLLIFILQNTEKIRLHFLGWTFTWPLWIYTIVVALFGAVFWHRPNYALSPGGARSDGLMPRRLSPVGQARCYRVGSPARYGRPDDAGGCRRSGATAPSS